MKRLFSLVLAAAMAAALLLSPAAAENHMSNFTPVNKYTTPFKDVPSYAWFAPAVKTCYEYDLMNGTAGSFNPKKTVSIGEVIAIAARIHDIYNNGKDDIRPNPAAAWYQPYVDYAIQNGLIKDWWFPDYKKPAIRRDIASIFADALPAGELHAINSVTHLPDMGESRGYYSALLLYNAGILTGSGPERSFKPFDNITRAEIAAITARMIDPDLRVSFVMLDRQDLSPFLEGLAVFMPAAANEAGTTLTSASGDYRCELIAAPAADLTPKAGKELLSSLLQERGYTMDIGSVRPLKAAFGKTPVLGYNFAATDEAGKRRSCRGYVFTQGETTYTVTFLTLHDSAEFQEVLRAPTLGGAPLTFVK